MLQRILTEFSREEGEQIECDIAQLRLDVELLANLRTSNIKNRCTFQKGKLDAFD